MAKNAHSQSTLNSASNNFVPITNSDSMSLNDSSIKKVDLQPQIPTPPPESAASSPNQSPNRLQNSSQNKGVRNSVAASQNHPKQAASIQQRQPSVGIQNGQVSKNPKKQKNQKEQVNPEDLGALIQSKIGQLENQNKKEEEEEQEMKNAIAQANNQLKKLVSSATNSDSDTLEKLNMIHGKYMELFTESKRLEREYSKLKHKQDLLNKEKDSVKSDLNKMTNLKTKLESLCRELTKDNKRLKEDAQKLATVEAQKREELSRKFESTIAEIKTKMDAEDADRRKRIEEGEILKSKLSSFLEQYNLREQHFASVLKSRDLEIQLLNAKLSHITNLFQQSVPTSQNQHNEQQKVSSSSSKQSSKSSSSKQNKSDGSSPSSSNNQNQIPVMPTITIPETEITRHLRDEILMLRKQVDEGKQREEHVKRELEVYVSKFKSVEETLEKSNEVFGGFRVEMEVMTKKTRKLEKENATLRSKYENLNANIITMAEERQKFQNDKIKVSKEMEKLKRQKQKLEDLARWLQTERNSLLNRLQVYEPPHQRCPGCADCAGSGEEEYDDEIEYEDDEDYDEEYDDEEEEIEEEVEEEVEE
ncbi:myosin-like coiled-coil protein-domain-containing protein [Paraphysoderma sedebokerense]|nr:myosin-like coiled-coil protein-domain-containing protein [Paraphysoderma sedebokerense]